MKTKAFRLMATLFVAALSLGFTACGGDDDDDDIGGGGGGVSKSPVAVDLGLPSGTKWADRNVGAESPSDCGDYFAWGETEVKSDYSKNTYTLGNIGNDIAGTQYDVAHVKWGGSWRLPTKAQCEELVANTTSEWVNDYEGTGVKGRRFTGKNGQSIFLPAAGYREGTSLINAGSSNGGYLTYEGDYWSSTYSTIEGFGEYPYFLTFSITYGNYIDGYMMDGPNVGSYLLYDIYLGFTVRPVQQ